MKTKNLFLSMLAVAGMLFAGSCSQEEPLDGVSTGESVNATFTIGASNVIGTRAQNGVIGNGLQADMVACAVYDANGNELTDLYQIVPVQNQSAVYNVRLVKGQAYRVAFFAYNSAAKAYDVSDLKNITVMPDQESNLEARDAFTNYVDLSGQQTMNAINQSVVLYRPFAQLNLGIDAVELQNAQEAGVVVTESSVTVSNVYNAFSAYDNTVASNATLQTMSFSLNSIPSETLYVDALDANGTPGSDGVEEEYTYLALNYLLVGDQGTEKSLTDVQFTWSTADGKTNVPASHFLNIPVQRNYRTNIIGKLLTNPATFNITIDATFDGNYTVNPQVKYVTVMNAQELQNALDNAQAGYQTIITFGDNISGNVTASQILNADVVVDGAQFNYDGQITINGNSRVSDETLALRNIRFTTSTPNTVFIWSYDSNAPVRYAHNVTIDNCTFTANGNAIHTAVAAKFLQAMQITMTNCVATNMHTIFQSESCNNGYAITVDNVKTVNCKNSVSFNNTQNAVISNSTLQSVGEDGYGVRSKGEVAGYSLTVSNCNINAFVPVLVRNMTANGYTINLKGNNTFTTTNGYQVVISNTDYSLQNGTMSPLVAPTGTYSLTGADNLNVYPRDILVYSTPDLQNAMSKSAIIKFMNDITVTSNWNYQSNANFTQPVTIDGQGHTIKFQGQVYNPNNNNAFRFEAPATVKNLTMDLSGATATGERIRAISTNSAINVDNCTFIGNSLTNTRGIIYGEGAANFNFSVSITNSNFTNWKRGVTDNENGNDIQNVTVKNCTFTNASAYLSAYSTITFTGNALTSGAANLTSWTSAPTVKVVATGNVLDPSQNNVIGSPTQLFGYYNVDSQTGFTVNTIQ